METLNKNKIAFIVCTNNSEYMSECRLYLESLYVPDYMEVDIVEVFDANSITSGYNEGMHSSDAKYKIYLHQDVFIINKNFITDMLDIFNSDNRIGMIGMVGTPYMYKNGTMWYGIRLGNYYRLDKMHKLGQAKKMLSLKSGVCEVEAIDGFLMATQYDLEWREDIFKKWDFYDVSQSFEFRKAGYKVIVPGTEDYWCIHDCGIINLDVYDKERMIFLNEYSSIMEERQEQDFNDYRRIVSEIISLEKHIEQEEKKRLFEEISLIRD